MRRTNAREAALRQRAEIAAQRNRYYQARADGLSRDEASAVANGAETHVEFVKSPDEQVLIARPDQTEGTGPIEIPDDWKFLPYLPRAKGGSSLRGLATKVSDEPINSAADAVAAIEAELARRAT